MRKRNEQDKCKGERTKKMLFLICVLMIAVIVDIMSYKIPNMCIVIGLLVGLLRAYSFGGIEAAFRATGLALMVFALGYPFYLMRGIGAGDIKLMMVIACYLPKEELKICVVVTMLIAGVIAVIKLLFYKESRKRFVYLFRYLRKLIWCQAMDDYEVDRENKHCVIRLSVPMFWSVLLQAGGIL